jgi:hypothetical protein
MRFFRLKKGLLAALCAGGLLLGGGLVLAQDAPAQEAPAPAAPAAPDDDHAAPKEAPDETKGEGLEVDIDMPMKVTANIPPGEMVSQASDHVHRMQEVLKRVVQLQDVARRQKDVIKLNCVNDKLLQVKQLLNIAEGASTNMQEAMARKDDEGRYHEFGRITIATQQVTVLGTEAETCIGEDLSFLGPTEVTVEQPEEAQTDPTQTPEPVTPTVEPPPPASPFV